MITVFIHGQTANTGTRITLFSAHCITQQSKVWSECHSVTAWNVPEASSDRFVGSADTR